MNTTNIFYRFRVHRQTKNGSDESFSLFKSYEIFVFFFTDMKRIGEWCDGIYSNIR